MSNQKSLLKKIFKKSIIKNVAIQIELQLSGRYLISDSSLDSEWKENKQNGIGKKKKKLQPKGSDLNAGLMNDVAQEARMEEARHLVNDLTPFCVPDQLPQRFIRP